MTDLTSLTSGKLAGMQAVLTSISDPTTGYLTQLNADRLGARLEHEHPARAGTDLNGNRGRRPFFTVTAGSDGRHDRSSIRRSSPAPALVAASRNRQAGDAGNAIALADLQRSTLAATRDDRRRLLASS